MKNLFILLLAVNLIVRIYGFDCSISKNMSINPMDYRSYYVCVNQCPSLKYCQSPQIYFSEMTATCVSEPNNWIPRYYLSGTVKPYNELDFTLYLRQDGYEVIWTLDDSLASETFSGRYLNETYVQGILVRRLLTNNCINVFDVDLIARADRDFCVAQRLHPHSIACDTSYSNNLDYCRTLTI